ncbi:MAG: helix-turn-helix transcriptional regulator [Actinobacteria bacterium]|nr:helix-turn-helix transcriptional regulator [Actinomycetota bacterium]
MHEYETASDEDVVVALGARAAAERIAHSLTQAALAREAGLHRNTVERFESGKSVSLVNLVRILRALGMVDRLDAVFPAPDLAPVEMLRHAGRPKRRVRASGKTPPHTRPWRWDDAGD